MKTIYKSIFIIALVSLVTSCNFTNLQPTDKVNTDEIFSSTNTYEQAVTGIYSKMSLRTTVIASAILSDDVIKGGQNGGSGDDSFQWTYTSQNQGDAGDLWLKYYSIVAMTNRLLDGADKVPATTNEEIASKNNSIGTVLFMRAYTAFDLLRFFADFNKPDSYGIPYVTKYDKLATPGRNSVKECFDLMIKDLNQAMPLLKEETPSNPVYVSKTAVKAMLARVYFYSGDYEKAFQYSSEALKEKPLAKMSKYAGIWTDENTDDVIMELKKLPGEETIGTVFYGADNSSVFQPSPEIIASYDANDIRLPLFVADGVDRDGVPVKKMIKYKGTPDNVGLADQKILRSSEMLLIMAESKARANHLAEANQYLNDLRRERIQGWSDTNYSTQEELLNQILLERRRELCYEGHRFFDMRRFNLPIVKPSIKKTLDVNDFRRLQPIPMPETQGNPVIAKQQNPGY